MNYLNYEQFGAIGDGVADDFDAIIKCHEEANKTKTPVKARDGAVYYISGKDTTAVINTDVDFGTAKFIIDDRCVANRQSYVFSILSENPTFDIDLKKLDKDTKTLDIAKAGNYYVRVINDNSKKYIRKGLNMNNGTPTCDCFILDESGKILPSLDWDYPEITKAYARSIDDTPITVRGGTFVTIANEAESFYTYYQRGIHVARANVTICDYSHFVENEGEHGAPYHGFIRADEAVNLTIKNATITPRLIYWTESKIPGKPVPMGSYDLSFWSCIGVHCEDVVQTIDITNDKYWGIYTSNFCKNLSIERCVFSRFDAHQGVTNATIKNCRLGFQGIQLIGHGEFLIEGTSVETQRASFINLRGDYGSLFDGNITVKDCVFKTRSVNNLAILNAYNDSDHDFGYTCMMGKNVTVNGFTLLPLDDNDERERLLAVLGTYHTSASCEKPYPYLPPECLTLSNITSYGCDTYTIAHAPKLFADTKVFIKKD